MTSFTEPDWLPEPMPVLWQKWVNFAVHCGMARDEAEKLATDRPDWILGWVEAGLRRIRLYR